VQSVFACVCPCHTTFHKCITTNRQTVAEGYRAGDLELFFFLGEMGFACLEFGLYGSEFVGGGKEWGGSVGMGMGMGMGVERGR